MPKNIIISHVYSKHNNGDAALLSALINDIKKGFKNSSITILTLDSVNPNEKFDGVKVKNSFMFYAMKRFKSKPLVLLNSIYVMLSTLIWAYILKHLKISLPINERLKKICLLYQKSDLIIPVGGGYIRSQNKGIGSLLNIVLLLHPIKFASILNKPTILYSQSIGPFSSKLEEKITSYILNKNVRAIIVRESTSYDLLKKIGVTNHIYKSIDCGFAVKNKKQNFNLHEYLKIEKNKKIIGITARKWLKNDSQKKYEQAIADTVKYIIKKYNIAIVFIPQVTAEFHQDDDRKVHNRIYKLIKLPNVYLINEQLNHHQIIEIYSSLDYVIGTRFHSVIFSLISYVPAIAIEYEHKTGGIMHDLKLNNWVIKMEKVTARNLSKKFDLLYLSSDKYKKHLKSVIPIYSKKAENNIKIVKKYC